jgi:N-acetylglucosaminyldiphosphoundecaprenol N-acetyl-beta-D-mannosaminyltransferase
MSKTVKILGVKFDNLRLEEAAEKALKLSKDKTQHLAVTPNPEIILKARKSVKYKEILNSASLSVADGAGVIFASKAIKTPLKERVTGVDLTEEICKKGDKSTKIFLLGAGENIAKKTAKKLQKKYPQIKIAGHFQGDTSKKETEIALEKINKSNANILLVAFGAPKQEIWITENLKKIPAIKLAIGVGGTFDFISGKIKRAPKIIQKTHLEWLYRLIKEPRKRLKRIFNAVIVFPIIFCLYQNRQNS